MALDPTGPEILVLPVHAPQMRPPSSWSGSILSPPAGPEWTSCLDDSESRYLPDSTFTMRLPDMLVNSPLVRPGLRRNHSCLRGFFHEKHLLLRVLHPSGA